MMRRNGELGQATFEVAAAAVAIVFVVIGFFTLGGVGIVSIKSLLLTRYEAEKAASSATGGSGNTANQIASWNYTSFTQGGSRNETFTVPFLAGDEAVRSNSSASTHYLDNPGWSLSNASTDQIAQFTEKGWIAEEDAEYVYQPYRETPAITVQNAVYTGNATVLSMLHTHGAVLPDGMKESGAFDVRFKDGWIDTGRIDITGWPSSSVSFPAFGPRR